MPDTNKTITAPEAVSTASAVPVKPAAAGENKAPNAAPAKPASVSKPAEASTGTDKQAESPVQPKASAVPQASPAASSKPVPAAVKKVSVSAPAAQPSAKPAAAAQSKAAATDPQNKPGGADRPTTTQPKAQVAPKTSSVPSAKPVAQDKSNLPSASTGNELQKKDSKVVPKQEGKLVIPDLVLTARPVITTVEKISSRLSPGMKLLLFALLVPTFLSLIYFGLWASPMYIAEARFAVRGADNGIIDTGGLVSMLLPAGSTIGTDVNIVTEYIQSPDIMEAVDKELHIFDHFASHDYDIISRLESDATRDERLSYWQWAVKPSLDPETGIVALSVKAYEPDVAQKLAEAVLAKSEALVNAMSRRAQDDATLAMREVKTAERRVSKAQEAMRSFRDRSGMLDPTSTAGGLQGIVSELESEVVKTKAQIAEASTYMSKDAPALVGLRARLAAVEKQLAAEKLRLAGESKPGSMTSIAGEYEDLQIESEFARQQLVSAMTSLEAARVKAEAQSRYVVAFQIPVLPDESLYPRPFLFTLFVFVGALVIVGICSLIIAAVREHAGF